MADSDLLHRFLFDNLNIRGEVVQLDATWKKVLEISDYPEPVRNALGEAMAAASLLVATLKIEGSLTFQIRSEGPVHLLVVQADSNNHIRGIARWQGEIADDVKGLDIFGDGNLVITADPESGNRYQGIVPLEGDSLQDALRSYFELSEQLPTRLWLSVNDEGLGGMLLQGLPGHGEDPDAWNRVMSLADTITDDELIALPVDELLYRLFHEEEVRVFEPTPMSFQCSCSREKIETVLRQLGKPEAEEMLKTQENIEVDCEFCGQKYSFDSVDVLALFAPEPPLDGSATLQ